MPKKNFIGYFSTLHFCFWFFVLHPAGLAPEDVLIVRRAGSKKLAHRKGPDAKRNGRQGDNYRMTKALYYYYYYYWPFMKQSRRLFNIIPIQLSSESIRRGIHMGALIVWFYVWSIAPSPGLKSHLLSKWPPPTHQPDKIMGDGFPQPSLIFLFQTSHRPPRSIYIPTHTNPSHSLAFLVNSRHDRH